MIARHRFALGLFATSALALGAAACRVSIGPADDSPSSPTPTPPDVTTGPCGQTGSGTLAVTLRGLPAGAEANAAYDGSSGHHAITKAGDVPLAGGLYVVLADAVFVTDPVVGTVYKGTASVPSVCVKQGETANVAITYKPVPSSNKLWALNANGQGELLAYGAASLQASGTPAADVSGRVDIPRGLAFDREGGLWATAQVAGASVLAHYPADALAGSGAKTPDVTVSGAELSFGAPSVTSLAFDAKGNLWVSAPAAKKILRYDASQLTASGSPAPAASITGVEAPGALAFDAAGNLWAASGNAVVEYAADRLATSTSTPADVVLSAQTPAPVVTAYQSPSGLAFDAAGNLWVDYNGGALVRFTGSERAASATVTPGVQIALDVTALAEGLAFDESGGLWFAYAAGKLARLGPAQLAASAKVTPSTILTSPTVGSAGSVAFYPAPTALPLFGKHEALWSTRP
jgi:sugar lactone lactonase YvrE